MDMKKIAFLATGGTIASENAGEGLAPVLTPQELLAKVPGLDAVCQIDCIQLFNLDSTNMEPAHWCQIAEAIQRIYEAYDGFVISHGTDTMAYSAAALSYLIQNSAKPIIFTGAQKPIGYASTDSLQNLKDAFLYASKGQGGVQIVFNGKVILGTRARKVYSKSFRAFSSVNYPELAVIQDGRILQYIYPDTVQPVKFCTKVNPKVGLLKLIPGVSAELLKAMLAMHDGLVIESFGVGGLPEYGGLVDCLHKGIAEGKSIVMTTQVPNEGSNLEVYHVGNRLKHDLHLLEAYDMTTEAVVTKLMWILGQTQDRTEIEKLFYRPVAHDILYREM